MNDVRRTARLMPLCSRCEKKDRVSYLAYVADLYNYKNGNKEPAYACYSCGYIRWLPNEVMNPSDVRK